MKCSFVQNHGRDAGLLLLRVVLGSVMIAAGIPKLLGGTQMWEAVGGSMGLLGINFAPTFWGFMATFAELAGGAAILAGIWTLPAGLLVAFTMLVASFANSVDAEASKTAGTTVFKTLSWNPGTFVGTVGITVPLGFMALALALTGPGKFSLKKLLCKGGSCPSGK